MNTGEPCSSPEAFAPKPAARPVAEPKTEEPVFLTSLAGRSFGSIVLAKFPRNAASAKAEFKSVTNNTDLGCGIALVKYDYTNCFKVFEFKACPRFSEPPE